MAIEGKFGKGKRRYGLDRIIAKLPKTSLNHDRAPSTGHESGKDILADDGERAFCWILGLVEKNGKDVRKALASSRRVGSRSKAAKGFIGDAFRSSSERRRSSTPSSPLLVKNGFSASLNYRRKEN